MDGNTTTFSLAAFTNVLAGGGALLGIGGVVVVLLAVVYALCCRRGKVSFTRTGFSIEPSPPRAPSEETAHSREELPHLRVPEVPPVATLPKRDRRKSPKSLTVVPGDAPSEEAEGTVSGTH
jgi:hypothetical protein